MDRRTIRLVTRNYDIITPLLTGDVVPEGIDLELDRSTLISEFVGNECFQAGEMSFSGYVRQLAAGGSDFVGLPIFPMRVFRQRGFFVRRDGGLSSLGDLQGKRIGTNGWPDSGNTWARALLRAEGVSLDEIDWFVGPIDGATDEIFGHRFATAGLPSHVRPASDGMTLLDMLLAGEIDAMMVPWPPRVFYEPDGPVVRLLPDYRHAEEEYARSVGYFPAHHLLGVRASVLAEDPWIAQSLFDAFERSRQLAEERRSALADTSPWLLTDLDRITEILGPGWQAGGVAQNRAMTADFCEELHAQGIIEAQVEPERVFADFLRLTSG